MVGQGGTPRLQVVSPLGKPLHSVVLKAAWFLLFIFHALARLSPPTPRGPRAALGRGGPRRRPWRRAPGPGRRRAG